MSTLASLEPGDGIANHPSPNLNSPNASTNAFDSSVVHETENFEVFDPHQIDDSGLKVCEEPGQSISIEGDDVPEIRDPKLKWIEFAYGVGLLIGGVLTPISAAFFHISARAIGSSIWAAGIVNFLIGVLALFWDLGTGLKGHNFSDSYTRLTIFLKERPALHWLVLWGGFFVVIQNVIISESAVAIGTALLTLGTLIGQVLISIVMDAYGLVWVTRTRISWLTIIGAIVIVAGSIVFRWQMYEAMIHGGSAGDPNTSTGMKVLWTFLSLVKGLWQPPAFSLQTKMGQVIGRMRRSIAWNCLFGGLLACVVAVCHVPRPKFSTMTGMDGVYLFSLTGIGIILTPALVLAPRFISIAKLYSCYIAGQLLGAFFVDGFGLFNVPKESIDAFAIIGLVVTTAGVVVVSFGKSRGSKRRK